MDDEDGIDYDGIARAMDVLANPNRLRILRQLLAPRTVSEIRLTPEQPGAFGAGDRPVSRQGVRLHVDRLLDLGVVRARPTTRSGATAQEYLVDPARLFALGEEFRKLGALRPKERWAAETVDARHAARVGGGEGPRLVLVRGVGEGTAFPLDGKRRRGSWTIGREAGADVALDYDPYVSSRNAVVETDGKAWSLTDLGSRNGTRVDWTPVPAGASVPLAPGAVIGVGRSLLVFRA